LEKSNCPETLEIAKKRRFSVGWLLRKRGALSTSAERFRPDQISVFGLFAPIDSVFDFVL